MLLAQSILPPSRSPSDLRPSPWTVLVWGREGHAYGPTVRDSRLLTGGSMHHGSEEDI